MNLTATLRFRDPDLSAAGDEQPTAVLVHVIAASHRDQFEQSVIGQRHPHVPFLRCYDVVFSDGEADTVQPDFIVGE